MFPPHVAVCANIVDVYGGRTINFWTTGVEEDFRISRIFSFLCSNPKQFHILAFGQDKVSSGFGRDLSKNLSITLASECSVQFAELDRCCENLKVRQNSIDTLQILYNKQRQSSCILKQNEREYIYVCMYMHWVRLKVMHA